MKTIEKLTRDGDIQCFEIITSRKELASWMKMTLWDALKWNNNVWEDDDSNVCFYDKQGSYTGYFAGDTVKRPNIANIAKMVSGNTATTVIYGDVPIVYDEYYGDWEAILD